MAAPKEKPIKVKREGRKTASIGKELTAAPRQDTAGKSKTRVNSDAQPSLTRYVLEAGFTEAKTCDWLQPVPDQEIWLVQLPSEWDPASATEFTLTDQTPGSLAGNFNTANGDEYTIWEEHAHMNRRMYAMPGASGCPLRAFDRRITFSRLQPDDADLTALAEQIVAPDLEAQREAEKHRAHLTGPAAPIEIQEKRYGPNTTSARAVAVGPAPGTISDTTTAAEMVVPHLKKKRRLKEKHMQKDKREKKKKTGKHKGD
ncbi:hypothetical protein WJX74_002294 [Apatococcus lobatus]|uniref:Uncharacterized protein n=1 Tax=Apatococcus lobatus TaxID=904363 RepID=A0AAW1RDI0_9CHLO